MLGPIFRENCPDLHDTQVVDLVRELEGYGMTVDIQDSCADPAQALREYDIGLVAGPKIGAQSGLILAVAHDEYITQRRKRYTTLAEINITSLT